MPASMRPPEFTAETAEGYDCQVCEAKGFNEAAGIHRRKHKANEEALRQADEASMRPPEFTGGN